MLVLARRSGPVAPPPEALGTQPAHGVLCGNWVEHLRTGCLPTFALHLDPPFGEPLGFDAQSQEGVAAMAYAYAVQKDSGSPLTGFRYTLSHSWTGQAEEYLPSNVLQLSKVFEDSGRMQELRSRKFSELAACWPGHLFRCDPKARPDWELFAEAQSDAQPQAWAERVPPQQPSSTGAVTQPLSPPQRSCASEAKQIAQLTKANLYLAHAIDQLVTAEAGTAFTLNEHRIAGPVKSSRHVPEHPFKDQKTGLCDPDEETINGGCWVEVGTAPCRPKFFEHAGKCFMPVHADSSSPVSKGQDLAP